MKTVKCPKCGKKAEKSGIAITSHGRLQFYLHKTKERSVYFCVVPIKKK